MSYNPIVVNKQYLSASTSLVLAGRTLNHFAKFTTSKSGLVSQCVQCDTSPIFGGSLRHFVCIDPLILKSRISQMLSYIFCKQVCCKAPLPDVDCLKPRQVATKAKATIATWA